MARFEYKGFDENGSQEEGFQDAESKSDAYRMLVSRGVQPYDLREASQSRKSEPWYNRDLNFGATQLSISEQANIASLFAILLENGIKITEILALVAENAYSQKAKSHFRRVEQSVLDGHSLSVSFENGPAANLFSDFFKQSFKLIEKVDAPEKLMKSLAQSLKKQAAAKNEVQAALIYPAILVISALVVMLILAFFLAPNLSPLFTSAGKPIPLSIAFLLVLERWVSDYLPFILSLFGISFLGGLSFLKSEYGYKIKKRVSFKLPVLGGLFTKLELIKDLEVITVLLASNLPLLDALNAAKNVREKDCVLPFAEMAKHLRQGEKSAASIKKLDVIPSYVRNLYRIGEETNRLEQTSNAALNFLRSETTQKLSSLTKLVTPLLTLILGLAIAAMIYTIMSAILDVNNVAL